MKTAQTAELYDSWPATLDRPERSVIVVDETLAPGHAANAAAVLALTLGARLPALPGPPLVDADGLRHPGLFPAGLPVLRASADALALLHARARAAEVGVIAFPVVGQQTTDYEDVRAEVAAAPTAELRFVGLLVSGEARAVRKLTGSYGLLR